MSALVTFVSHTAKPGGGELALRRYLDRTALPVRLVTTVGGGVWEGLGCETIVAPTLRSLRSALRCEGLIVANSMRTAFLTGLLAKRRSTIVYWVRDGLVESAMSPLALQLTRHVTRRRVSHYLSNSRWTAGTIREALGVKTDRISVVHSMSGVTADWFDQALRPEPDLGPLRLLFLGRLSPWKAPDVAVRALTSLAQSGVEAQLTIAGGALFGEHDYVRELQELVAAEPRARLTGHVDDVRSLLMTHDILVHCSTRPEPFGQVIIQGLAAGVPVVATDAGGPVETLSGSPVPLTYRPGDAHALAGCIQGLVPRYAEVAAWSVGRAREFSDDQLVELTDAALVNLLHRVPR